MHMTKERHRSPNLQPEEFKTGQLPRLIPFSERLVGVNVLPKSWALKNPCRDQGAHDKRMPDLWRGDRSG